MVKTRFLPCLRHLLVLLGLAVTISAAAAQTGPAPGSREAMWPAPTGEDWKRPCLIAWQRTYEDALAVSRETGKAILICVNMDGEIASEHYAGIRYRQSDIAALYEPYVTVIASVYRHTPRDYDEEGRRILCPRFGSVTCGEHIAIEPGLFDKFMDGRRIAPRHIMVELDGEETYDVYYAFDTDSVFNTIREGVEYRPNAPTIVRGDRSIIDRVASRDNLDQTAVESAYQEGDPELRRSLLEAAAQQGDAAPVDLLRLGIFGLDVEMGKAARSALSQSGADGATDLISDALRVPLDITERDALIAALERIGESSPRARTLAVVHQGLVSHSSAVDLSRWEKELQNADGTGSAIESYVLDSRLQRQNEVLKADDAEGHVELAEAFLARAFGSEGFASSANTEDSFTRYLFMDAYRTALEAEKLGAEDWRVNSIIALASYYLGEAEEAHTRAAAAVHNMPSGDDSYNGMAVLELFAKMRCQAIAKAVQEKKDWPSEWLADVNASCSVLARHPHGTDAQIAWHYDILKWLKAHGQAARVLDQGLARFPDSWTLHNRLRGRILRENGVAGLESVYETMLLKEDSSPKIRWFAGYADLVAAEFYRRSGNEEQAVASYDRAISHYEKGIEAYPDDRASADHFIAVAKGGLARIAFERGDHELALQEVLASFERKPESAATLDGLNISAVDTAKMLLARLKESEQVELVAKLETALASLDPELLRLPAYEGDGPLPAPRRRTQ